MAWISTSVLFYAYSKLYILTELSANDVKFISVDRQKLDLSIYIYIYLWYRKFHICRDTARFYEHKNDPRIVHGYMGGLKVFPGMAKHGVSGAGETWSFSCLIAYICSV